MVQITDRMLEKKTSNNYDYFMNMDVSSYMGQWVAICDEKVVAHSRSFKEVFSRAKEKCGKSRPLWP